MSKSYTLCPYCSQQYPDGTMGDKCPDDGHYLVDVQTSQLNDEDGLLGKCVGEEFAVVGVIGAGAFGTVYMACQMPIRRPTALKILHAQKAQKGNQEHPTCQRKVPKCNALPVLARKGFWYTIVAK